jgi:hypothetical protein
MSGGVIRTNEYPIITSAGSFGTGDVLKLLTSGDVDIAVAGDTNLLGPCAGVSFIASDGEVKFSKRWVTGTTVQTGTTPKALVWDDPSLLFRAQTVTGTAFTQAMIGGNADLTVSAAGGITGQSATEINISSVVATTANTRIYGLINDPENALGEHADIEVIILEHILRPAGTTGI